MPKFSDPAVQRNIGRLRRSGLPESAVDEFLAEHKIDVSDRGIGDKAIGISRKVGDPILNFAGDVVKGTAKSLVGGNIQDALEGKTEEPSGPLSPRYYLPRNTPFQRRAGDIGVALVEDLSAIIPAVSTIGKLLRPAASAIGKAAVKALPGAASVIRATQKVDKSVGLAAAGNAARAERAGVTAKEVSDAFKRRTLGRDVDALTEGAKQNREFYEAGVKRTATATKAAKESDDAEAVFQSAVKWQKDAQSQVDEFMGQFTKKLPDEEAAWAAVGNTKDIYVDADDLAEGIKTYGERLGGVLSLVKKEIKETGKASIKTIRVTRKKLGEMIRNANLDVPGSQEISALLGVFARTLDNAAETGRAYRVTKVTDAVPPPNYSLFAQPPPVKPKTRTIVTPTHSDEAENLSKAIAATRSKYAAEDVTREAVKSSQTKFVGIDEATEAADVNRDSIINLLSGRTNESLRLIRALGDEGINELKTFFSGLKTPKVPTQKPRVTYEKALAGIPKPQPAQTLDEILGQIPEIPKPKSYDEILAETRERVPISLADAIKSTEGFGRGGFSRIVLPAIGSAAGATRGYLAAAGGAAAGAIADEALRAIVRRYGVNAVIAAMKPVRPFAGAAKEAGVVAGSGFARAGAERANGER